MKNLWDRSYEFKGTRFHLRAFEDPFNAEKPVFVVEEAAGSVNSLQMNRVEIARELSDTLGRTPEQITWLEQSPDGTLKQIDFEYTHTDRILPETQDMPLHEAGEEVQAGRLEPLEIDRYNTHEREASRSDFQAQLGDALEPYEVRQNEEFRQMELPPVVIDIGELRELPSQHDFENDPDLTL